LRDELKGASWVEQARQLPGWARPDRTGAGWQFASRNRRKFPINAVSLCRKLPDKIEPTPLGLVPAGVPLLWLGRRCCPDWFGSWQYLRKNAIIGVHCRQNGKGGYA
jgi:hypothetical protein